MPRHKFEEGDPQDTEGNALRSGRIEPGEPETDDTEGQRIKFKVETGEPETDDTEGNKIKFK